MLVMHLRLFELALFESAATRSVSAANRTHLVGSVTFARYREVGWKGVVFLAQ